MGNPLVRILTVRFVNASDFSVHTNVLRNRVFVYGER